MEEESFMLKYIGDFDKLKDYGFEYSEYAEYDKVYNYVDGNCYIDINLITREVWCYWGSPRNSGNIEDDYIMKLYDLIKDGLVIKEEE
jgi:hypothetical protein